MKSLEERILKDGVIINNDILKVDSFLNHQIDVALARDLAKEITEHFNGDGVNKILTIETSGIAFAYAVAQEMGDLPLVFAKKSKSATVGNDVYTAQVKSFTRNTVSPYCLEHRGHGSVLLSSRCFSAFCADTGNRPCVSCVPNQGYARWIVLLCHMKLGFSRYAFDILKNIKKWGHRG